MKLGTTIALCAVSAIGTAIALDKVTEGAVRDVISDILIDRGLDMADDFDDFDDEKFNDENFDNFDDESIDAYNPERDIFTIAGKDEKPFCVMMPIQDATNIYHMLEDAVGRLSESASDLEAFGDKAISFERLYDALEKSGVVGNPESAEEISEPISDDPSVCGHSEENCDAEDPDKLDPDSGNYEITSKKSF